MTGFDQSVDAKSAEDDNWVWRYFANRETRMEEGKQNEVFEVEEPLSERAASEVYH